MTAKRIWRTSSYTGSGADNACVEIAWDPTTTAIRDSKSPSTGTLTIPQHAFHALITRTWAGR
jgi:hypothetical protein